ncbi:DUF2117 domain-containing protein [Methanothermococcus sp.]|uniref:DUF2117 domain-containing protein n=1 Tax=Methanothermococcus sp. TaxID=2614238 RepID=UPI0025D04686|nr:DUF2117 domain-containing protein [Methanothermococcus sp.]
MDIGMVIHGPEIIDTGYAKKILNILKDFSNEYNIHVNIRAKLGGTMGRVAVIDNNLQDVIDISEKLVPSMSLKKLGDNDILILMNYGKSKETGHTFGKIVVERSGIYKPIIQIERPGEKDGTILIWNKDKYNMNNINKNLNLLIEYLSKKLNLNIEECISNGLNIWNEGNRLFRKIHGVDIGEPVMINGIVVGRAKGAPVILVSENNRLIDIINGEVKWHGVEKLGEINLKSAIVKTGILRRHPSNTNRNKKNNTIKKITMKKTNHKGEIIFVNHAGEDVLEKIKNKNVSTVITVGDDTTIICGDILARFGIKIIGITDGDRDDILKNPMITEGSNIFLIKNCKDDDVGKMLEEKLKNKKLTYENTLQYIKEFLNNNKINYDVYKS